MTVLLGSERILYAAGVGRLVDETRGLTNLDWLASFYLSESDVAKASDAGRELAIDVLVGKTGLSRGCFNSLATVNMDISNKVLFHPQSGEELTKYDIQSISASINRAKSSLAVFDIKKNESTYVAQFLPPYSLVHRIRKQGIQLDAQDEACLHRCREVFEQLSLK